MIELKENDLLKIKIKKTGEIQLAVIEKVNAPKEDAYRYFANNCFGFNDDFMDDFQRHEIIVVWRYNEETGNFLKIYDKEELCQSVKPADISWDEHNKVLQENAELREVIVNQAKEINSLKKGS